MNKSKSELKLDNDTRWNSKLAMMQTFLELREAVILTCNAHQIAYQVTAMEVDELVQYCRLLQLIAVLSEKFQGDSKPLLSSVPWTINNLLSELSPVDSDLPNVAIFRSELFRNTSRRTRDMFTESNVFLKASALDVRYGHLNFLDQ